jgi:hypothetical protein
VRLVDFTIEIYHDSRPYKRQIIPTFRVIHPSAENQPLKSADDWYSRIFKNKIRTVDALNKIKKAKKIRHCDRQQASESWDMYLAVIFVCIKRSCEQCYISYTWHDFYNKFKLKHKLYTASESVPPPPSPSKNTLGAHLALWVKIDCDQAFSFDTHVWDNLTSVLRELLICSRCRTDNINIRNMP